MKLLKLTPNWDGVGCMGRGYESPGSPSSHVIAVIGKPGGLTTDMH
jgi:hypothetical protein